MIHWVKSLFGDKTLGAQRSPGWSKFRYQHIRDRCEVCGSEFFLELHHVQLLELHHVQPFWQNPELELDPNNVITVCRKHHFEWCHFFDWSSWNKDIRAWVDNIKSKP
jgi:5-methylcytosine-specific restriction enzyme A